MDTEVDGDASGSVFGPHIESSDSEVSDNETHVQDTENLSSDDEFEQMSTVRNSSKWADVEEPEITRVVVDDITFLTPKCDESKTPHLNQHFPTIEDAFIFYKEYRRICGFDVRYSSKKSNSRGRLYARHIECSHGGHPGKRNLTDSEGNVIEGPCRRTTSIRCYCKAKIVVKPAGNRGFVIMSFVAEHNHSLASGPARMFLRCNRNVSVAYQNFIMDCSRANIGPTRAHSLVKEMTGSYENVGATVSDFKNFARDVKIRIGLHDTNMLLDKFKQLRKSSKDIFYYDYKVDRNGCLTGLFWTDAIGQANYSVFGDIISFDPTFRTNKYNMVFVPFTGVDSHWKNVTFAAGLLAKENYKNFKWLILTFKKAMSHAPPCVITDQCKAIKKALDKWWRSTTHRLCMWHIMNKLPMKVGPKIASDKKFVQKLKSVVYADHVSPSEFEALWKAVISEYKLESNAWFSDLYDIRAQWIPAYFNDIEMAGLLRTTSRSESSNFFFQHYHDSGDTLVEFYSSFESAMDKQRLRNAEDERRSQQIPLDDCPMSIELDASNLYTLELYYLVREEIRSGRLHTSMIDMTRDDDARYFKCKDDILNEQIFEVSVRNRDSFVECSCKFYFRRGYLCRHAFAALHHCSVNKIPQVFVKPRWSKNALQQHSFLGSTHISPPCGTQGTSRLKRTRAWFEFNNCMTLAGNDNENLDSIIFGLNLITAEVSKKNKGKSLDSTPHRAERFVGPLTSSEVIVHNPNVSRNKGCGSRIKSSRELSAEDKKKRKCGNCGQLVRHNVLTCPEPKKPAEP